jgi:hypothetical protein
VSGESPTHPDSTQSGLSLCANATHIGAQSAASSSPPGLRRRTRSCRPRPFARARRGRLAALGSQALALSPRRLRGARAFQVTAASHWASGHGHRASHTEVTPRRRSSDSPQSVIELQRTIATPAGPRESSGRLEDRAAGASPLCEPPGPSASSLRPSTGRRQCHDIQA